MIDINFGRAKTILIILFVFVNIFLISYMFSSSNDNTAPNSQTVKNTIEILQKRNVFLAEDIKLSSSENINFINLKGVTSDERVLATKLLGEYKIKNGVYESDSGVLSVKNGTFVLDYKDDHTFKEFESDAVEKYAVKFLKEKEFDTSFLKPYGVYKESGNYRVDFYHYFLEKPVFNLKTSVYVSGGGVYKISGSIFALDSISPSKNTNNPINVLLNYSAVKESGKKVEIKAINAGYYVDSDPADFKLVSAVPCYELVFADGETLYYDAVSATAVK